ncbi:MAG: response regulator, partial [Deltaproteobacteria bacterium]|nr:response regulator [Deltaproteobacteria bacterium]
LTILGNATQIHQILFNLCTNAAHAMRDKPGILEIGLSSMVNDQNSTPFLPQLPSGLYGRLTVKDTGRGMDEGLLNRIFDPFFTTKGPGEGTGMGLSVVYGIVKSYGGEIIVDSEVGKGSAFHVYFPLIMAEIIEVPEAASQLHPKGHEHILLVDDEEDLVEIGIETLQHFGYQVTGQTSSVEALALFREQPEYFDVVITDQTMPQMTGIELAAEINKIRADIPVILCTGFSHQISQETVFGDGIKHLLMKPYVLRDVAKLVRSVLDHEN